MGMGRRIRSNKSRDERRGANKRGKKKTREQMVNLLHDTVCLLLDDTVRCTAPLTHCSFLLAEQSQTKQQWTDDCLGNRVFPSRTFPQLLAPTHPSL